MGYTPIRNHLAPAYGKDRLPWAINAVRDSLMGYFTEAQQFDETLREIDAICALALSEYTILPPYNLGWESDSKIEKWLPKTD